MWNKINTFTLKALFGCLKCRGDRKVEWVYTRDRNPFSWVIIMKYSAHFACGGGEACGFSSRRSVKSRDAQELKSLMGNN